MARFRKFKAPKIATVIGSGTTINGDVNFTGGLHVDGLICGNVMVDEGGDSALTLSEQGRVEGDIRVPNVILNGTVVGDVYASERVELAPKAKVTGTVYYNLLEMAMGAEVNGQLIHTKDVETQMLGYDGDRSNVEALKPDASVADESQDEASERIPRGR
ncbi:bactofilin family protein [Sedimenticola selenatireducens]|jgi:cytoskeletal protein CcmA (bactofilin family)|uniref:Polymer-forming cytoskeletal protein n=1 Tax=Sedimenticola selenatireducens TaxID=191960 RepID=A0A557S4X8_9GAMM|nr:polymer-forming cytoskeletal protein [Sedimenticola selenatireducens]TVO72470.1 polymer-forming cytoskeletal protein [Sedimenticola selenatireducens]TVT64725.1 MAG: polymer-forming cytoskeletal protein [Sedimenticola selenatireducens]